MKSDKKLFVNLMHGLTVAVFVVLILLIAIPVHAAPRKVSAQRQKFITYALTLRGVPYVYGGHGPEDGGFDCSGFVSYVTKHGLNISLPRTAQAIYDRIESVMPYDREPGDLVFFKNNLASKRITHVGIYLGIYKGEGKFKGKRVFISAVSDGPKTGVLISAMDEPFWKKHYFASGRFLPSTDEYNAIMSRTKNGGAGSLPKK